jgi:hypothetical protein
MFDPAEVTFDRDAPEGQSQGPFPAWIVFTWRVNAMQPETFSTDERAITLEFDVPAKGWVTERYQHARVIHPPVDSGNKILVQADDMKLYHIWDVAYHDVITGGLHTHEEV